jgi:arylsulfatase A-like enzyme
MKNGKSTGAAPRGSRGEPSEKPNILVIFGDDIGQTNLSAYSFGVVGYKTQISIELPKKA